MICGEAEPMMTYERWAEGQWFRGMRFDTTEEWRAAMQGYDLAQRDKRAYYEDLQAHALKAEKAREEESKRYAAQIAHEIAARAEAEAAARKRLLTKLGGRFCSVLMELRQIMAEVPIMAGTRVQLRFPEEARRTIADFTEAGSRTDYGRTIHYAGIEMTFGEPWGR